MTRTPATPADWLAAAWAAHQLADYWLQTGDQAARKGLPGREGQLACARHVAVLAGTKAAALLALHASGRTVHWKRTALALAVDAGSHYFADRRMPLRQLAEFLDERGLVKGNADFWSLGMPREGHDDNPGMGTGQALLDQSWHGTWAWIASLIAAA